jgi:hypothetical protein
MSIQISKSLLPLPSMTTKEKFGVMQQRRKVLVEFAKTALISLGYTLGASLKVPGAHTFQASLRGKSIRIGIKTCADRWLSIPRDGKGGYGLLSAVDQVLVIAFDNWQDPNRIQIYLFDPEAITKKAAKAYAEAERVGLKGLQWLPLDEDHSRRPVTARIAGDGLKHDAQLIFDEPIEWTESSSRVATAADTPAPIPTESASSNPELGIMDRIKSMLSEQLGVRAELIEVDVRVKV